MTFNDIKIGNTIFVFNPYSFLTYCLFVAQIDKIGGAYCFKCYAERTSRMTNLLIPQSYMSSTIYGSYSPNIGELTKIKADVTKIANKALRDKMPR